MPGNRVLPPHTDSILTRGLQEWAGVLPQALACASVARLLSWQSRADALRADTTIRSRVWTHGQLSAH